MFSYVIAQTWRKNQKPSNGPDHQSQNSQYPNRSYLQDSNNVIMVVEIVQVSVRECIDLLSVC